MSLSISVRGLNYTYPQNDQFSLEIDELQLQGGRCYALTGPNGCGKTTLGKLIAGLIKKDANHVFYNDEDIFAWPLGKIGRRVGYLFQEPSRQIFAATVLEEMIFPRLLAGRDRAEAERDAERMLALFELHTLCEANTFTLSRGEKQRLALAAMMMESPDFFILDEPTTGLDKSRRAILFSVIQKLLQRGAGILLITHDREFADMCEAAPLEMQRGRLHG